MRKTFAALLTLMSFVAIPGTAEEPEIPRMTREEALAYIEAENIAVVPSNLVVPIMNGDAEKVEALLSAGVDVNDTSFLRKSFLRLSASSCAGKRLDTETILLVMEVLLAHGAKPNESEPSELSALMVAAQQCPAPIVRRLVKAGADLEFRSSLGYTPLSMAFIVGNLDAAEALIDVGARLSEEAAKKLLEGKSDDARFVALVKKARAK